MTCAFCGGDLNGNPMRWPAYLLRVGLHCGEHDAAMCPWCLMCQGAEQTEAVKILAREKREVAEKVALLVAAYTANGHVQ